METIHFHKATLDINLFACPHCGIVVLIHAVGIELVATLTFPKAFSLSLLYMWKALFH